ncbi:type II toxin-antitoxin system RelE/ParE family toxin [Sphingobium sp. RSMS]|nr:MULTISPECIES: type II toxin-antitoxin system RelE/ParE family toxin [unclassified Sphingobium]UXC93408.1 type II toxin-antitoxin system RelE/ParE family toxin [Sphingobium sp. RSMS]
MGLEFSPAAAADLVAIATFTARDNVLRAVTFVDELEGACAKIADFPRSGVARPEIRAGLRSKPHGSYVKFYSVLVSVIRIERILHGPAHRAPRSVPDPSLANDHLYAVLLRPRRARLSPPPRGPQPAGARQWLRLSRDYGAGRPDIAR